MEGLTRQQNGTFRPFEEFFESTHSSAKPDASDPDRPPTPLLPPAPTCLPVTKHALLATDPKVINVVISMETIIDPTLVELLNFKPHVSAHCWGR